MSTLRCEQLQKSYGTHMILNEVSFTVPGGKCLALMGESGAGKTTTLRMLAGLEIPDHGKVFLDDAEITSLPPARRSMAMVFQTASLFPHTTVAHNITYGMVKLGYSKAEIDTRLHEVAVLLNIEDQLDRYPGTLSLGQAQRADIARALIRDPGVLLLDEPFSSLDQAIKEELLSELRAILRVHPITMVYVTHSAEDAFELADEIAFLDQGKVMVQTQPEDLSRHPVSVKCALMMHPKLTIVEGEEHNGVWTSQGVTLPHRTRGMDGPLLLGILPEHTMPGTDFRGPLLGQVPSPSGILQRVSFLDKELLVHGTLHNNEVEFSISGDQCFLFDGNTGSLIL